MPRILTDHETILRWAQACGVRPLCADPPPDSEQDDVDLQLAPVGQTPPADAQPLSWPAWFQIFDARNLALVIEDACRQPSPVHRVITRPE